MLLHLFLRLLLRESFILMTEDWLSSSVERVVVVWVVELESVLESPSSLVELGSGSCVVCLCFGELFLGKASPPLPPVIGIMYNVLRLCSTVCSLFVGRTIVSLLAEFWHFEKLVAKRS